MADYVITREMAEIVEAVEGSEKTVGELMELLHVAGPGELQARYIGPALRLGLIETTARGGYRATLQGWRVVKSMRM